MMSRFADGDREVSVSRFRSRPLSHTLLYFRLSVHGLYITFPFINFVSKNFKCESTTPKVNMNDETKRIEQGHDDPTHTSRENTK